MPPGPLPDAARRPTADALSAMRDHQAQRTALRIAWAGRIAGAAGWMPGLAEELLASRRQGQPVLLLGSFGGVSHRLAQAILQGSPVPALTTEGTADDPVDRALRNTPDLQEHANDRFADLADLLGDAHDAYRDGRDVLGLPHPLAQRALTTPSAREALRLAVRAAEVVAGRARV